MVKPTVARHRQDSRVYCYDPNRHSVLSISYLPFEIRVNVDLCKSKLFVLVKHTGVIKVFCLDVYPSKTVLEKRCLSTEKQATQKGPRHEKMLWPHR